MVNVFDFVQVLYYSAQILFLSSVDHFDFDLWVCLVSLLVATYKFVQSIHFFYLCLVALCQVFGRLHPGLHLLLLKLLLNLLHILLCLLFGLCTSRAVDEAKDVVNSIWLVKVSARAAYPACPHAAPLVVGLGQTPWLNNLIAQSASLLLFPVKVRL